MSKTVVVKLTSSCSIPVNKLDEILRQAKRFGCKDVSLVSDEQISVVGVLIASSLKEDDLIFTINSSGTEFFRRYVKPRVKSDIVNYCIDPKTNSILLPKEFIKYNRIVIIDDVIDSGETMRKSIDLLSGQLNLDNVNNILVYSVVSTKENVQVDNCENCTVRYFILNDSNSYVIFPWEL